MSTCKCGKVKITAFKAPGCTYAEFQVGCPFCKGTAKALSTS